MAVAAKFVFLYLPTIAVTAVLLLFFGGLMCSKGCTPDEEVEAATAGILSFLAVVVMTFGNLMLLSHVTTRSPRRATLTSFIVLLCDLVVLYFLIDAARNDPGSVAWPAAAVVTAVSAAGQVWLVYSLWTRWRS